MKRPAEPLARESSFVGSGTPDEGKFCRSEEVPFKLTLLFLGCIGAVPCTWKKPHFPRLHLTKSTFVVGFAISVAMFICLCRGASFYIHRMLNEEFPLYVKITISIYFAFSLYFSSVISVWLDVQAIQRAIQIWMRLSDLYLELTKRRPKMRSQTAEKITIALVLVVPSPTLAVIKDILSELHLTYEYILPFIHLAMIVFPLATIWAGYCSYVAEYAKEINKEITQCVQENSLTSEKMRIYRDIWIQMKSLSDTISDLNTFFLLLVITLPTLVIGAFAFILYLQERMYFVSSAMLIFCVTIVLFIGFLGRSTDLIIDEIKYLYTAILSLQNFSSIETGAQFQVINMYLIQNVRPVNPTFSGFLSVTKAVIPSMLSAVTMNIVILAQLTQPQTSP